MMDVWKKANNLTKFVERPRHYITCVNTKARRACKIVKQPFPSTSQKDRRRETFHQLRSLSEKDGRKSCKKIDSNGRDKVRWYSPKRKAKFGYFKEAHKFQDVCKNINCDENHGWMKFARAERAMEMVPAQLAIHRQNHISVQADRSAKGEIPEVTSKHDQADENKENDDECFICDEGGCEMEFCVLFIKFLCIMRNLSLAFVPFKRDVWFTNT